MCVLNLDAANLNATTAKAFQTCGNIDSDQLIIYKFGRRLLEPWASSFKPRGFEPVGLDCLNKNQHASMQPELRRRWK